MVQADKVDTEEALNVSEEHIYYVRNGIQNTFKIVILDYAERMREMFEMAKLIPPTSKNNKEYHEAAW